MPVNRSNHDAAALMQVSDRATAATLDERAAMRASVRGVRAALWPIRVAARVLEDMSVPAILDELEAAQVSR